MKDKARIGVIGAGWWAVENHLPVLAERDDVVLAGVCRLGASDLERVKSAFGFQFATEDYRELLENVELDGVIVSSPHPFHHEHAVAALTRGIHVMVEKPLASNAEDARGIVDAARRAYREIVIPYGWNFRPYTRKARELVQAGAIGDVRHVSLHMASALRDLFAGEEMLETSGAMFRPSSDTWAAPDKAGGYGWGQLAHALGLLFRITDILPEEVFAWMGSSPVKVDYYDAVSVRFSNGATAAISGAATVPKHSGFQIDLRVFGTEGMLLLDIERERLELRRDDQRDTVFPMQAGDGDYVCVEPVERFVEICRGMEVANDAPGAVGLAAVELLDAAYRSNRSGRKERV